MRLLSLMMCFASLAYGFSPSDGAKLLKAARLAEVVLAAEVLEVQPPPGRWSRANPPVQHVRYKVLEVL